MNMPKPEEQGNVPEEWARRRKANVQLGFVFGGVALLLFAIALWKYRPL